MKRSLLTICAIFCLVAFAASSTALAVLTDVQHSDGPQDPLIVPELVDELGILVFPPDELISTYEYQTNQTVCFDPATPDDLLILNVVVGMVNLTPTNWTEVWYVADPEETLHSNFDGWVNGGTAFRIDWVGIHAPLIFENILVDGIFQAGETWEFVIQDYSNIFGTPASVLGSIAVPSPFGPDLSSGSIIAIPEPVTICLLGLGSLALLRRRRK